MTHHAMKVTIEMPMTAGTNHTATRSASFCKGARERCASLTSPTICASRLSATTCSASLNQTGTLVIQAEPAGGDTLRALIGALVRGAQRSRAPLVDVA